MICNKSVRSINVKKRKHHDYHFALPLPIESLAGLLIFHSPDCARTHINHVHFRLPRIIITEAKTRSAADPTAAAEKRLKPIGQRPRRLEFPAAFHLVRLQLPAGAAHAGGAAGVRALSG